MLVELWLGTFPSTVSARDWLNEQLDAKHSASRIYEWKNSDRPAPPAVINAMISRLSSTGFSLVDPNGRRLDLRTMIVPEKTV